MTGLGFLREAGAGARSAAGMLTLWWIFLIIFINTGWAATPIGTPIENAATISYTVDGHTADPTRSNTDRFEVEGLGRIDAGLLQARQSPPNPRPALGDTLAYDVTLTNAGDNALRNGMLYVQAPHGSSIMVGGVALAPLASAPPEIGISPGNALHGHAVSDLPPFERISARAEVTLPLSMAPGNAVVAFDYHSNDRVVDRLVFDLPVVSRSAAVIELLYYAPGTGAQNVIIRPTQYYNGSGYADLAAPASPEDASVRVTDRPLPLARASVISHGQILFLRIADADQNVDPGVRDGITVTLRLNDTGDVELLRLYESGVDTGVFTGYVTLTRQAGAGNDGVLNVATHVQLDAVYVDAVDSSEAVSYDILVDPYGRLFDSTTGVLLDGYTVHLLNADNGQAAQVYGDDGVSRYPATAVTGGSVTDSSGRLYQFDSGSYRFPFVAPGNYRLVVVPPADAQYRWPSQKSDEELAAVPNGPFVIDLGSRAESFPVREGPPLQIDIPVDPITSHLYIRRSAAKEKVSPGDFLPFKVSVENTATSTISGVTLSDQLPRGLRYRKGSARLAGMPLGEPAISGDGRTLTFSLGDMASSATHEISYVVEVGAAPRGMFHSSSEAQGNGGLVVSNRSRVATRVIEEFMRSENIIAGQVVLIGDDGQPSGKGVAGARIYLEDGSFSITDENGRYHFAGVKAGTHVVQLDRDSLPEKYRVIAHEQDSQFAGSAWSKFVDLRGGTLWQVDFHAALQPKPQGHLRLHLTNQGPYQNNLVQYRFVIESETVPVGNLRVMLMLPEGVRYQPGTSRVGDVAIADPEINDGVLVYTLADMPAGRTWDLSFGTDLVRAEDALLVKAMLMFDTSDKAGQRSPVIEHRLALHRDEVAVEHAHATVYSEAGAESNIVEIVTLGSREQKLHQLIGVERTEEEMANFYNEKWLQTARRGIEWLYPEQAFRPEIPAVTIAIKHDRHQKVRLYQNGKDVPEVKLEGIYTNQYRVALTRWKGVDLVDGDNLFEAAILNQNGVEIERHLRVIHYSTQPVRAELDKEHSILVADSFTAPVIAFRLYDKDGVAARRTSTGEFRVNRPYRPLNTGKFDTALLPGSPEERYTYTVGDDGLVRIRLEPTHESGEVRITLPVGKEAIVVKSYLVTPGRDWIVVGFAEGTVGHNTLSGKAEELQGKAAEQDIYADGKVAFYAKGQVKGEWLLTMAYDSDKQNPRGEERLFRTIDPGTYYTVYGDASVQGHDAASREKLYLKLERDAFQLLFGDYTTDLGDAGLTAYNRALTGLKSEYHGDGLDVVVFASESDEAFVRDELRGQGITGPYRLSRRNILLNSEQIMIETRDRFHSQTIVASRKLARHVDYDIDYQQGTVHFRAPVSFVDADLNPNYIVIHYESFHVQERSLTYGGRVAGDISEAVELGLTHVNEGREGGEARISGADIGVKIGDDTLVRAEIASSDAQDVSGKSGGDAYGAEISHRGEQWNGKAYVRETDAGFGLGQTSGSESGTRKMGVETTVSPQERTRIMIQLYQNQNVVTRAKRNVADVQGSIQRYQDTFRLGARHAQDEFADGSKGDSSQVTAGVSRQMLDNKANVRVDREQSIGSAASVDYPNVTRVGADYVVTESTSVFAEQEWTDGSERDTSYTQVGVKTSPWEGGEVVSTVRSSAGSDADNTAAGVALNQKWQLSDLWSIDFGAEKSTTISSEAAHPFTASTPYAHGSASDYTAGSIGASYNPGDWTWHVRTELRDGATDDLWAISTSMQTNPTRSLSLLASLQVSDSRSVLGMHTRHNALRLDTAYRPASSRWMILDRLELLNDVHDDSDFGYESNRIVNQLNANYRFNHKWQVSLQHGIKHVKENIDQADHDSVVDLYGLEGRYNLNARWDAGAHGSVLHSWRTGQYDESAGVSVGHSFMNNVWVSVGYNFTGFDDRDFSRARYTSQGMFLKFRIKFDQVSLKEAVKWAGQ